MFEEWFFCFWRVVSSWEGWVEILEGLVEEVVMGYWEIVVRDGCDGYWVLSVGRSL